ncbi:RING-H2 finger protein ATL56-like [Chenopodium quinoa]|uniref:RING-type domain-containing protein n=1 Tax=Chenopodium quinoa TaxID=63459 RepID=A0A803N4G4_CHEQI|nr:RING-H2 finger protein ATL56-like [Chenopodium quinoa]
MPRNNRSRQNAITGNNPSHQFPGDFRPPETLTKSNPKLLSILLQALIMAFVISLFFIFVGVAAIIFIHLCIAGGALRHRHRRNQRRPISGNEDLSSGYSLELLKTLPKSLFKGSEVCTICLDNLLEGESCRVLPGCNHVFHLNCVDKWILKSPVCPVCRSSIKKTDHEGKGRGSIDWEHLWAACG